VKKTKSERASEVGKLLARGASLGTIADRWSAGKPSAWEMQYRPTSACSAYERAMQDAVERGIERERRQVEAEMVQRLHDLANGPLAQSPNINQQQMYVPREMTIDIETIDPKWQPVRPGRYWIDGVMHDVRPDTRPGEFMQTPAPTPKPAPAPAATPKPSRFEQRSGNPDPQTGAYYVSRWADVPLDSLCRSDVGLWMVRRWQGFDVVKGWSQRSPGGFVHTNLADPKYANSVFRSAELEDEIAERSPGNRAGADLPVLVVARGLTPEQMTPDRFTALERNLPDRLRVAPRIGDLHAWDDLQPGCLYIDREADKTPHGIVLAATRAGFGATSGEPVADRWQWQWTLGLTTALCKTAYSWRRRTDGSAATTAKLAEVIAVDVREGEHCIETIKRWMVETSTQLPGVTIVTTPSPRKSCNGCEGTGQTYGSGGGPACPDCNGTGRAD